MSRFPGGIEDSQLASGLAQVYLGNGEDDAYVGTYAESDIEQGSPELQVVYDAFMWLIRKSNSSTAGDGFVHFYDQHERIDVDDVAQKFLERANRSVELGLRTR
jgi:hypothetical protein